jgi:hypothetical protein
VPHPSWYGLSFLIGHVDVVCLVFRGEDGEVSDDELIIDDDVAKALIFELGLL